MSVVSVDGVEFVAEHDLHVPANPAMRLRAVYNQSTLARGVADAAAILDEHVPGWSLRITQPIEMGSVYRCVLGQVFKERPRRWFGLRYDDGFTCGYARGLYFLMCRGWDVDKRPFVFSSNQALPHWEAEIKRRASC